MLRKSHKLSAWSLRGGTGWLAALFISGLLAALAFGGNAHAAGLIKVAAPSVGTAAALSQANGLPLAGAPVTPPPTTDAVAVGAGQRAAAAASAPAGAVAQIVGKTPETARDAVSQTIPAAVRGPLAAPGATNSLAGSGQKPAGGTLSPVTNTTPHALERANTLANALSAHAISVTGAAPTTTATVGALAVAPQRAGRLLTAAGKAARTLTGGTLPARVPFRVATEALKGAAQTPSGAGSAPAGSPEASAGAAEALPGVLEGVPALASLPLPLSPGLPATPLPIPALGQPPGIAPGGLPALAPSGVLTAYPPVPAVVGSRPGGWLAGGFEAGLPGPSAPASASPAPQRAIGSAQAGGAFSCTVASPEELLMEPCGAARAGLLGQGSFLVDANALDVSPRGPPPDSGAIGVRDRYGPASVLAGSGSGEISGGPSGSAAGASGLAITTLLMLAAVLLAGGPRIMRWLSLACEQWLATAFALIPERPG